MDFPLPLVTVDAVLLTLIEGRLQVALHRRTGDPCADCLALPGGVVHVDDDESLEATIVRVLKTKTGFSPRYMEQLQVFSGQDRDPRRWSLSVAYLALVPVDVLEAARKGVFHFYAVDQLPKLAFDHNAIVAAAVQRVRNKTRYSSLPTQLLPNKFTLAQLQKTYEVIIGSPLDKSSFRRKLEEEGVVVPTEEFTQGAAHRPARLYKATVMEVFDRVIG
jgi:ADP-ribose pyrophosphatase YjhB (NUDIX family)